jgi:2-polyprenyl-6-methoxyphenol hydroxylase-like FAD-dependent oxidoreductase
MVDRCGERERTTVGSLSDRPGGIGELRIAVAGGGAAGLTAAAALNVRGRPCRVYERRRAGGPTGMAIVLSAEAVADLASAGLSLGPLGVELHRYRSYHPDGVPRDVLDIPAAWRGLSRAELVDALYRQSPPNAVVHGAELATLELDGEGAIIDARLATGQAVRADLYVAADGAHSLARRRLYPDWPERPARVSELVGIVYCPPISEWAGNDLHKFHVPGVSIGILSVGGGNVGWFMQFDCERFAPPSDIAEARREFAHRMVGGWADPVPELLRATDFALTHVCRPIDADLVPRFYSGNLVLLGDAAHPLLPFTSQGLGAAIAGARDLTAVLDEADSVPAALAGYSAACRSRCVPFINQGRELTRAFLTEGPHAASVLPLAVPSVAGSR